MNRFVTREEPKERQEPKEGQGTEGSSSIMSGPGVGGAHGRGGDAAAPSATTTFKRASTDEEDVDDSN